MTARSGDPLARVPLHVVPDVPGHGVVVHARQVAAAVGAPTADVSGALALPTGAVHLHVTDRLFGATCEEAARLVSAVAARHPTTLTLHDVPQPDDGTGFDRRRRAYASMLRATRGWVVSSRHERALVERHLYPELAGEVIPLPVLPLLDHPTTTPTTTTTTTTTAGGALPRRADRAVVGVLGWVYPGKGHEEVLRACAALPEPVTIRVLGRVAPGHDELAGQLRALAAGLGVALEITGWVDDADLPAALADVDVPVAAHRKVSASGSINSWLGARRRPLVVRSRYTEEMGALRPGTLTLLDPAALHDGIRTALAHPTSTHLPPGASSDPGLPEVAERYRRWWATR